MAEDSPAPFPFPLNVPADADYDALCAAIMASARGRAFLHEYARRNRNADTERLLEALSGVKAAVAGAPAAERDSRFALLEMANAIARARADLGDMMPPAGVRAGEASDEAPPEDAAEWETEVQEADAPDDSEPEPQVVRAPDLAAAATRLAKFTRALREHGMGPATCQEMEKITRLVLAGMLYSDTNERRAERLAQALHEVEWRVDALLEGGPATASVSIRGTGVGAVEDSGRGDHHGSTGPDGAPELATARPAPEAAAGSARGGEAGVPLDRPAEAEANGHGLERPYDELAAPDIVAVPAATAAGVAAAPEPPRARPVPQELSEARVDGGPVDGPPAPVAPVDIALVADQAPSGPVRPNAPAPPNGPEVPTDPEPDTSAPVLAEAPGAAAQAGASPRPLRNGHAGGESDTSAPAAAPVFVMTSNGKDDQPAHAQAVAPTSAPPNSPAPDRDALAALDALSEAERIALFT